MSDPEIDAMSAVATAVADLDEAARGRVLRWAAERYTVSLAFDRQQEVVNGAGGGDTEKAAVGSDEKVAEEARNYEHFAELFSQAGPKSDAEKALVAAYWVQVHQGQSQWPSRLLNAELKHLGHSVGNVTMALSSHINRKPQRVIQLKKSGNSKQGNKTYKVTSEGITYIQAMLSGGDG